MRYGWAVIFFVLLTGCEKAIDFKLKETEPVLAVDGSIETGTSPVIILSTSLNYFSGISAEMIAASIVKDAVVTVFEGNRSERLQRVEVPISGNRTLSFYTGNPFAPNRIVGEEGKTYRLQIKWQGRQYEATTTIPVLEKRIDSIWWVKAPNTVDTSTRVVVRGRVTDPPRFGNYIRYFTRVNSGPFLPGFNSVFDDQLINGTTYEVDIDRGVDRNLPFERAEYGFFRRGDTVTVKFSNIDKATFDFWRTVEFSYQSIGNPFGAPPKIMGNVSNGALGYFGGYANQFKTLIIPR